MKLNQLYRLSAFPKTIYGGNKAGVYIYADDLSDDQMQKIAKKLGYSETAFVCHSDKADFKVRFFTPTSEVDLCGHATIATFNLLRDLNIVENRYYTQETKAGILMLDIESDLVFMQQNPPVFSDFIPNQVFDKCFRKIKFHHKYKAQIISTGLREIFLPVLDLDTLNHLEPCYEEIIEVCDKYNVIGIHVFCLDGEVDAYGRNFAPIVGIEEESATGTSNGALACYLFKHHKQKSKYTLRQGYSMNQPSEIIAKIDRTHSQIKNVWVGGKATLIKERTLK